MPFMLLRRSSDVDCMVGLLLDSWSSPCSCAPSQDNWYDLSKHGPARRLRHDDPIDDPFWPGDRPLQALTTISDTPRRIKPDPAHCYAIHGWGTSLAASSLVLLFRLGAFIGSTIQACFDNAFEMFRDHCRAAGKTTTITEFSLKMLKMDSLLYLQIIRYIL